MNIALIFPKWTNKGIASYFSKRMSWPPLGLLSLAAVAEQMGHEVSVIDAEAEELDIDKVLDKVSLSKTDLIGITGTTPMYHLSVELAERIKGKYPNIPIAIGGNHITILREQAFESCFDYAFIGEAEESWREFLETGNPVKGMLYRDNGKVIFMGEYDYINDLDKLPFPARHLIDMSKYHMGTKKGMVGCASIMFSRGCPFECIFCSLHGFGKVVRRQSVTYMMMEINDIVEKFGIRHFYFVDDNLTLNRKYTVDLCDSIINSGLKITFEGSTRANLIDEELIKKLSQAGLIRLSFGLESANEHIREIAKKNVPLESYAEAARLCNKYGIEVINSVILGLPCETKETVRETINYLKNAKGVQEIAYNIAVPYPGTEMLNMAKRGDYGLSLLSSNFIEYRRHIGVMKVGELMPKDLARLQDKGYSSVYSVPWRMIPMLTRVGLIGFLLTYWRGCRSWYSSLSARLSRNHSSLL